MTIVPSMAAITSVASPWASGERLLALHGFGQAIGPGPQGPAGGLGQRVVLEAASRATLATTQPRGSRCGRGADVAVEDRHHRLAHRVVLDQLPVEPGGRLLGEQVDRGRGQLLLAPGSGSTSSPLGASASTITWFSPVAA